MDDYKIAVVKIEQRETAALEAQKILTSFGCSIKVRLGLHDVPEGACSPVGLLVLQLADTDVNIAGFLERLNMLDGVTAKSVSI